MNICLLYSWEIDTAIYVMEWNNLIINYEYTQVDTYLTKYQQYSLHLVVMIKNLTGFEQTSDSFRVDMIQSLISFLGCSIIVG